MATPIVCMCRTFKRTVASTQHLAFAQARCTTQRAALGTAQGGDVSEPAITESTTEFDSERPSSSAHEFVRSALHEALQLQYHAEHSSIPESSSLNSSDGMHADTDGTGGPNDLLQDVSDDTARVSKSEAPFFAMNLEFKLTDLQLKAILLSKCIEEFQKDVPSFKLDTLKTVEDVISFFKEPAQPFSRNGEKPEFFDLAQKQAEFPPNLHIKLPISEETPAVVERYRKKSKKIPKKYYRKY
eukprot:m.395420 g.395420  ORF g.395420 m.395420 type:complete len:242 (-) comp21100_c0_seq2:1911-2636(-)